MHIVYTHILYFKGVISTGDEGDTCPPHFSKSLFCPLILQFEFDLLNKMFLNCVVLLSICQNPDEREEKLINMLVDHLVHLVTLLSQ